MYDCSVSQPQDIDNSKCCESSKSDFSRVILFVLVSSVGHLHNQQGGQGLRGEGRFTKIECQKGCFVEML